MENKDNNNQEKELQDYYDLEHSDNDKKYEGLSFFQEVKRLIPVTQKAAEKTDEIREALRVKIKALKKEVEAQNKQKKAESGEKGDSLAQADLLFCQEALAEGGTVKEKVESGKRDLEDILNSGAERSYSVITDVALLPLPSDRAKNNENSNGGNGNGDEGGNGGDDAPQNPDKNQEKGKENGKLTPEQLAALRGTPEKNKAAKVSEKPADDQEHGSSVDNASEHKAEDRDKVLAARNGIAPESRGLASQPKPIIPRQVDVSQGMPKRVVNTH